MRFIWPQMKVSLYWPGGTPSPASYVERANLPASSDRHQEIDGCCVSIPPTGWHSTLTGLVTGAPSTTIWPVTGETGLRYGSSSPAQPAKQSDTAAIATNTLLLGSAEDMLLG